LESRQVKELEDMQKRHDEEQLNLEQEMKKVKEKSFRHMNH